MERKSNIPYIFFPILLGLLLGASTLYVEMKYSAIIVAGIIFMGISLKSMVICLALGIFSYAFFPDVPALLLCYAITGLFLLKRIISEGRKFTIEKWDMIIIAYLIYMIISTFTSIYVRGSLRDLAIHLGSLGIVFTIFHVVRDKKTFNIIITTLVLGATLMAVIGIIQYFTGVTIQREWVDVQNNPDMKARVYSLFGNPNTFAEYLVMLTPISVGLMWESKDNVKKLFFLGTTVIQLTALLLTMSRGGWVGIAAAALFFIFFVQKRLLLLAIPAGLAGMILLPSSYFNRILSIFNFADSSTSYRFQIWDITIGGVIRDHFLTGVGLGHLPFKQVFETYIRTMPIYHAHNTYLQIFSELGLLGFIVFAFLVLSVFKLGYVFLIKSDNRYERIIGTALLSGFFGVLVHGMFENVLYLTKITLTFWILLALIYTLTKISEHRAR